MSDYFSIDEFVIECPCLGRLEKIRIGHDNSGFGPGWFLDQVGVIPSSDYRFVKFSYEHVLRNYITRQF